MQGNDQVRFCPLCRLNVYNISEMTEREAEEFLQKAEGRTCIRMYQRRDGKVLTRNCPVGMAVIYRRLGYAIGFVLVLFFGGVSLAMAKIRSYDQPDVYQPTLTERARAMPVIGPVINYFSPETYVTSGVMFSPSIKSVP
jgi:hypothetical protein